LEDVTARHAEILKLEKSIRDLRDLFVEMSILVETQVSSTISSPLFLFNILRCFVILKLAFSSSITHLSSERYAKRTQALCAKFNLTAFKRDAALFSSVAASKWALSGIRLGDNKVRHEAPSFG